MVRGRGDSGTAATWNRGNSVQFKTSLEGGAGISGSRTRNPVPGILTLGTTPGGTLEMPHEVPFNRRSRGERNCCAWPITVTPRAHVDAHHTGVVLRTAVARPWSGAHPRSPRILLVMDRDGGGTYARHLLQPDTARV